MTSITICFDLDCNCDPIIDKITNNYDIIIRNVGHNKYCTKQV